MNVVVDLDELITLREEARQTPHLKRALAENRNASAEAARESMQKLRRQGDTIASLQARIDDAKDKDNKAVYWEGMYRDAIRGVRDISDSLQRDTYPCVLTAVAILQRIKLVFGGVL